MNAAAELKNLFTDRLDLSDWVHVKTREDYSYDNVRIPDLIQHVYERTLGGKDISVGVFTYKGEPAYIAWGLKTEPHCSFHSPLTEAQEIGEAREGCPEVQSVRDAQGHVSSFVLDNREIFGNTKVTP